MFKHTADMKKKLWLFAAPLMAAAMIGCKPTDGKKSVKENLVNPLVERLEAIPDTCFIFGHHDDPMYGIGWSFEEGRSDVKSVCGKYPGMMSFDLGGLELGNDKNLDGVPFDKMREEIIKQDQRGGFITLSWHLRNPKTEGDSWDVSDSTVVATILNDAQMKRKMESWLDNVANFLKSLKDKDGKDVNVIFRPWHEHTGSWFWWGQKLCTDDEYKALWKLTVDRLKEDGVKNVIYAYSPGTEPETVEQYLKRFPEGNIIKVVGVDCYQYGEGYAEKVDKGLSIVDSVAQQRHLIPALTETGFEGLNDATWWTQTLLPALSKHKLAYVVVWRNAWNKEGHFYAPYPGQISADDFKRFADNPRTIFAD